MKRQLISLIIILPLLSLFSFSEIYAQLPTGELTGTTKSTTSDAGGAKSGPSKPGPIFLAFGAEKRVKLDSRASKSEPGIFSEEMILKADSEDSLSFLVKSSDPSLDASLVLQIFGKYNSEIAVMKEPSGDFRIATQTGGLPATGEYHVRVTSPLNVKGASLTIKVDRLGLTGIAYIERFRKIIAGYNDKNPASVEETVNKLEKLAKDSPNYSTAFERLGLIYLEVRKDAAKAEWAMDRAIKANGGALIQIAFDSKWRPMTKLRSGDMGFEDKRIGWLKIQSGVLMLNDASNKTLETISGPQIKDATRTVISAFNLVTITASNSRKPYIIAPEAMRQVEADLVVKLINNYVVGKAVVEDRR